MRILWTGIYWLRTVSARHWGGCLFQYSQTICHSKQILGTTRSSHGGAAGTCQACSHAELPRCCFPSPQQATPQLGSIPRRRSVISRMRSLMILLNKLRKWKGIKGWQNRGLISQLQSGRGMRWSKTQDPLLNKPKTEQFHPCSEVRNYPGEWH